MNSPSTKKFRISPEEIKEWKKYQDGAINCIEYVKKNWIEK